MVVVDGPLLQRASTVVPAPIVDSPVTLNINMAPELPTGWSGFWDTQHHLGLTTRMSATWNKTVPSTNGPVSNYIDPIGYREITHQLAALWYPDRALVGVVRGCPSTCTLKIRAPALAPTCISHALPVDYRLPVDLTGLGPRSALPIDHQCFVTGIGLLVEDGYEALNLLTGFARSTDCVGVLSFEVCTLKSAIGEYDVTVTGDSAVIDDPGDPKIIATANNSLVNRT